MMGVTPLTQKNMILGTETCTPTCLIWTLPYKKERGYMA